MKGDVPTAIRRNGAVMRESYGATDDMGGIVDIMRHQNTITEVLVKQQRLSSLPPLSIPMFKGDPLEYKFFMRAFEHGIEDKTENCKDRLYFLEQFTMGQPRELVQSCQHMELSSGYKEAKRLLKKYYGNDYKIVTAHIDKARSWPSVKPEDAEALQVYSVFLTGCRKTMDSIEYMEEMDNPTTMRGILSKLPYKLKEKWRGLAYDLWEKNGRRARFTDFVDLIDHQARIISHPLFGTSSTSSGRRTPRSGPVLCPPNILRERKSGFTTSVSPVRNVNGKPSSSVRKCLFCQGEHKLDSCNELNKKPHSEKMDFLKKQRSLLWLYVTWTHE